MIGSEIDHVEILDAAPRGLLVIAVQRELPFELTEKELLRRLGCDEFCIRQPPTKEET